MLRCKIEIVPFGVEEEARTIKEFHIFNMGPVDVFTRKFYLYGVIELNREQNTGMLWDEPITHNRELGAQELVRKVLQWPTPPLD